MTRDRSQLVIALGEGDVGRRLRKAVDRAADRAGMPVSTWARERLLDAIDASDREKLELVMTRKAR